MALTGLEAVRAARAYHPDTCSATSGFHSHLVKPVDPEELREVLLTLADSMAR